MLDSVIFGSGKSYVPVGKVYAYTSKNLTINKDGVVVVHAVGAGGSGAACQVSTGGNSGAWGVYHIPVKAGDTVSVAIGSGGAVATWEVDYLPGNGKKGGDTVITLKRGSVVIETMTVPGGNGGMGAFATSGDVSRISPAAATAAPSGTHLVKGRPGSRAGYCAVYTVTTASYRGGTGGAGVPLMYDGDKGSGAVALGDNLVGGHGATGGGGVAGPGEDCYLSQSHYPLPGGSYAAGSHLRADGKALTESLYHLSEWGIPYLGGGATGYTTDVNSVGGPGAGGFLRTSTAAPLTNVGGGGDFGGGAGCPNANAASTTSMDTHAGNGGLGAGGGGIGISSWNSYVPTRLFSGSGGNGYAFIEQYVEV